MNFFEFNTKEKQLTKLQMYITLILIMFFSVTGATYAYFAISATNNIITGEAATVNLTLSVEKVFPTASSTNTGVMVPQLSTSSNSPLSTALKNGCVDGNGNVVCQVYTINIQNVGGTATQVVDGSVSFYSDTALTVDVNSAMPNLKWKLISSVNATTPSSSVLGNNTDLVADATDNIFADNVILKTNDNYTYHMIIWINETNNDQSDKSTVGNIKHFYGVIEFNSSNGTGVTSTFTA